MYWVMAGSFREAGEPAGLMIADVGDDAAG
jgi:hypothetical protein